MTWWDSEVVNFVNINTNRLPQQSRIFQKSWRHLKILCIRSVTRSTSFTCNPHKWRSGFVYPWAYRNFTKQYVAWEANRPRREILCVLWKPKSCYLILYSPTLTSVLIQMNQVPCRSHCFLTLYFNIIFSPARVFDCLLFPLCLPVNVCYAWLAHSMIGAIRPPRLPLF
jgi:hypothetical protein